MALQVFLPIPTASTRNRDEMSGPTRVWKMAMIGLAVGVPFAMCVTGLESINGRLATVPVYDDVSYLLDGASRIETLDRRGVLGLVESLIAHPPHSPVMTMLSFIGQVVSSGERIGVYMLGFIWIAVLAACWLSLAQHLRAPAYATIGVGLLLLSCPLSWDSVAVFRPDFAAAVFTAIAVGRVALGFLDDRRGAVISGIVAGLAILAKPTITPQTLFVCFGAIAAAASVSLWRDGLPCVVRLITSYGLFMLGLLLAAGWYLVINGEGIAQYIWQNNFGALRNVWSHKGSPASHLLFYVTGPGGSAMFGSPAAGLWWVLGSIAATAWLLCADTRSAISLGVAIAASYAVPTVNWHKNIYLGTVFQGLCVMACGWSLLSIAAVTSAIPRVRWMTFLSVVGLTVGGILCLNHRNYAGPTQQDAIALRQLSAEIAAIAERRQRPRIAMSFTGTINQDNVALAIWQQAGDILEISTAPYTATVDEAWDFIKSRDVVVAAVSVGDWIPDWIPLGAHQHAIVARLLEDTSFDTKEIELAGGRKLMLGIRLAPTTGPSVTLEKRSP